MVPQKWINDQSKTMYKKYTKRPLVIISDSTVTTNTISFHFNRTIFPELLYVRTISENTSAGCRSEIWKHNNWNEKEYKRTMGSGRARDMTVDNCCKIEWRPRLVTLSDQLSSSLLKLSRQNSLITGDIVSTAGSHGRRGSHTETSVGHAEESGRVGEQSGELVGLEWRRRGKCTHQSLQSTTSYACTQSSYMPRVHTLLQTKKLQDCDFPGHP